MQQSHRFFGIGIGRVEIQLGEFQNLLAYLLDSKVAFTLQVYQVYLGVPEGNNVSDFPEAQKYKGLPYYYSV
ncbi:MAG: hypothetical protein H6573_32725 [Lewinellaceae bacterium]|nr:hypothetical protein [Lewinellaceae bacterium]